MESLSGLLDAIVFSSDETGFLVGRIKGKRFKDPVTIVGNIPGAQIGEKMTCQGIWKNHPLHGRQFEIHEYNLEAPSDVVGIEKYLGSGLIKGIGREYAKRIVSAFGSDTLNIID